MKEPVEQVEQKPEKDRANETNRSHQRTWSGSAKVSSKFQALQITSIAKRLTIRCSKVHFLPGRHRANECTKGHRQWPAAGGEDGLADVYRTLTAVLTIDYERRITTY